MFSFLWSDNQTTQTAINLHSGSYSVLVTDQNGCYVDGAIDSSGMVNIYQPLPFNVQFSNPVYQNCVTVNLSCLPSGGSSPYSYSWSSIPVQTTQTATGLTVGQIHCTVSDASGCSGIFTPNVQPGTGGLVLNPTIVADLCNTHSGSISLTASGGTPPRSFSWNGGGTSPMISNLPVGIYTATVTDAVGCSFSASYSVPLTYTFTCSFQAITSPNCNLSNGAIQTSVSGGTAPFTYLWSNGATSSNLTGLVSGAYSVTITDASGCSRTMGTYLSNQQTINPNETLVHDQCTSGVGSITVAPTGGVAPYSVSWSTGASGLSITGLNAGGYSYTITDNLGCSFSRTTYIGSLSPIQATEVTQGTLCGMQTGTATITALTGGTPPYTFLWTNGATTQTTGPLGAGQYNCLITDAMGCTYNTWGHVQTVINCGILIQGNIAFDFNSNCLYDGNDFGISSGVVEVNPGDYILTDTNGTFNYTGEIGSYLVSHIPFPGLTQNCLPPTYTVNASTYGGHYLLNDFLDDANQMGSFDNAVFITAGPARPGFDHIAYANIQNISVPTPNQTSFSFTHDPAFTFLGVLGSSPHPFTYNPATQTVTWAMGSLSPGDNFSIPVRLHLPGIVPIGAIYSHTVNATPVLSEVVLSNNSGFYSSMVTASYDPNDKLVFPARDLERVRDSVLSYTIRFQNTGTDTAFTVVLMDTLNSNLNIESFRQARASHPFHVIMAGAGILQIRFENILLPPMSTNETASQGYFSFTINRKMDLPLGTEIKNNASIYFDFNEPIVTNTTLNIIQETVGRETSIEPKTGMTVFPNPSTGGFTVSFENTADEAGVWAIYDLRGQVLWESQEEIFTQGKIEKQFNFEDWSLAKGIYFLRLTIGDKSQVQKIVYIKN